MNWQDFKNFKNLELNAFANDKYTQLSFHYSNPAELQESANLSRRASACHSDARKSTVHRLFEKDRFFMACAHPGF